jgi:putative tryptophan/tyrosine transport system substrate-binding protein
MRRREFIALFGAAAAWPPAARAQAPLPKIGILAATNAETFRKLLAEALGRHGYIDGESIAIVFRSAEGKPNLLPKFAAELVQEHVDVIVAHQTPAVHAAKQATNQIPIVMAAAGDPVGTGLVASLARPGGNVTGLSGTTAELGAKTLELLRDMLPSLRRIAILANAADPFTKSFLAQTQTAAKLTHVEAHPIMLQVADDLEPVLASARKAAADAVIVQPSLRRKLAAEIALRHRLPAVAPTRSFAQDGGLMAYAASFADLYAEAAQYVDKILKGSKPAELPVQQPNRFELAINLKTAKALGLTVPPTLLARADEVIE